MKKQRGNSLIANLTQGFLTVGFLVCYPFHTTFWGGLLAGGFMAGMIGGFADWFAVTALFRRPFGIRPSKYIRTEIIVRNRQRIFQSLSDMVQNELITRKALKTQICNLSIVDILNDYLIVYNGRKKLLEFLNEFIRETIAKDSTLPARMITKLFTIAFTENIWPLLLQITNFAESKGYDKDLAGYIRLQGLKFLDDAQVEQAITSIIQDAFQDYEDKNPGRKLIGSFWPSPQVLATLVLKKLHNFFEQPLSEETILAWLRRIKSDLISSASFPADINHLTMRWLASFNNVLSRTGTNREYIDETKIYSWLSKILKEVTVYFKNQEVKTKLDNFLRDKLINWMEAHHSEIGVMVRSGLESLSNNNLLELIESKTGSDLQMIRINGSVVGFIAGIIIHLFSFFLSLGW